MEEKELNRSLEKDQSKRVAKLLISVPALEGMLPKETKVLGVKTQDYHNTFELIISHPSFNELKEGDLIPIKMLILHKDSHEGHSWISKMEYA